LDTGASEIRVVAAPHPLKFDTIEALFPAGLTVAEIIGRDDLPALVWVDGELIECEQWHEVIPQRHCLIKRVPADRNALRMLAFLALAVFAPGIGTWLSGSVFLATSAGVVGLSVAGATALVGLAGSLLINALIPPALPNIGGTGGVQSLATITGQSNQVAPWAIIPKVYGSPVYFPPIPMTGLPFTELVGQDQYIRILLVLGYGPLSIGGVTVGAGSPLLTQATALTGNPIKLGGTTINQFNNVEYQIGTPSQVTLFTSSIVEQAVNIPINRTGADPTSRFVTIADGNSLIQTTDFDTDEISLDVASNALFTVSDGGNTKTAGVNFKVETSPVGANTWTQRATFSVNSSERKPIRRGIRFVMPAKGRYDVRLTRVSSYYNQKQDWFNDFVWTTLRSIKRNVRPFDVPNTVVMALRIKATDQLGGRIDRLSVQASGLIPVWNGSAWVTQATRAPAWIYADILSGNGTRSAQPKSKIDTTALSSWATFTEVQGLYFDAVIDAEGTVFDRAKEVAAMGLASWHVTDDAKFSVIRDVVAAPRMVITPRNSSGFSANYAFNKLPHALRVQFVDPDRWEPTERIVYDDGYTASNATRYEQLQTVGVTNPDHAWKFGRYHLAQLRLRPETYSWSQDVQHLAYQRGDTVEIQNDVILVGLKAGRIKSITLSGSSVSGATVDETLDMVSGTNYAFKIQRKDGSVFTAAISTATGGVTSVTFSPAIAQYNYGSGNEAGVQVGDHFAFGVAGAETLRAKVTRIEPTGDFKANVVAVPAAENIFNAWTGTIPAFDPVLTKPVDVDLLPPDTPVITDISSESPPSPTGAPALRMVVAFSMPAGLVGVTVEARSRIVDNDGPVEFVTDWAIYGSADSQLGVLFIDEVEEGLTYQVQIRARRGERVSEWSATGQHTIGDSGWTSEPGATRNNWLGAWSSASVGYDVNDLVTYQGRTYICILAHTSEVAKAPSGTSADNTWWALFADKGDEGPQGLPGADGATGPTGPGGAAAVDVQLTRSAVTLFAYANGDVVSFADAQGQLKVYEGSTDVTASATLSASASGCTGSINTATNTPVSGQPKGFYRVTAMSADTASLTFTVVYGGVTYSAVFSLAKARGGYEIVSSLPSSNLFAGRVVFLTTDNKLYRYTGSAWTAVVPSTDITGQLTDAQIAALAAAKLTGQITTTQITDNAITTPKILAGAVTTAELAAGSVVASKLVLTQMDNLYPDVDFRDADFYSTPNSAVYSFSDINTANLDSIRRLNINSNSSARSVVTGWFPVPSSVDLSLMGKAFQATAESTSTATLSLEFGSVDAAGAVTVTRSITVRSATNTTAVGNNDTVNATTTTSEKRARFVASRSGGGSAAARFAGFRVLRRAAAELIVDGSILADKIASNAVTADKIIAGAVTAAKISVTDLSAISANVGTLTAGLLRSTDSNVQLDLTNAKFFAGKSTFATAAAGWFLGLDSSVPKFRIGNADNTASLTWDGSTLTINGAVLVNPTGAGNTGSTVTATGSNTQGVMNASATIVRAGAPTTVVVDVKIDNANQVALGASPFPINITLRRGGSGGTIVKTWQLAGSHSQVSSPGFDIVYGSGTFTYIDTDTGTGSTQYYVAITTSNNNYNEYISITATQTSFA
jgi:hypothetical protein